VYHGKDTETAGGLKKKELKKDRKSGEIVSKAKSKDEKKNPGTKARANAKNDRGSKGFALVQGPRLAKAREIYSK